MRKSLRNPNVHVDSIKLTTQLNCKCINNGSVLYDNYNTMMTVFVILHRVIIQQESGFKTAAEILTMLNIGLIKHVCREKSAYL